MRTIQWKVAILDNGKIASLESASGFPPEEMESHLTIIGILENLKHKHLERIKTFGEKTIKRGEKNEL